MAILDSIEVRIASKTTGKAFHEYDKPSSIPSADGFSVEKFIQAEIGLDFHIEIFVKPSFRIYQASGLRIDVNIDGGRVHYSEYWSKIYLLEKQRKEESIVSEYVKHREGTQWYRTKFNFGSLSINENLEQEKDVLDMQAKNLGVIKVSVDRVNQKKSSVPQPKESNYHPDIAQDVAKELVKQRHISHAMKAGEKTPIRTPKPLAYVYHKLSGENGRPCNFVFRYRSQMELELLGCNPHDEELGPLVTKTRRANHEVEAEPRNASAEQRPAPVGVEKHSGAIKDGNLTVAENREVGQIPWETASEQLCVSSVEDSSTGRRKTESTNVEKGHNSREIVELRTKLQALENKNSQLLQENHQSQTQIAALKQTNEKMAALIQNLMGNMTSAATPPAVRTPTPATLPAEPSYPQTTSTPIQIKRERIKEEDHAEGSRMSATTRNRPLKRTKTIDLTDD